jgi:hypothetical protein
MKIQQPDRELQQDNGELKETPNRSREKQSPSPKKQNITAPNWTKHNKKRSSSYQLTNIFLLEPNNYST